MNNKNQKLETSPAVRVQLARLFGENSKIAQQQNKNTTEWKKALKQVIRELGRYLDENVESDELHMKMLYSGLASAESALESDDFWPGYAEGVTRLALILMGEYPDHRKRKPGRKKRDYYSLQQRRTLRYIQNETQRLRTLFAAYSCGVPKLRRNPRDALAEFRENYGCRASYKDFFRWYKKTHPEDYSSVF